MMKLIVLSATMAVALALYTGDPRTAAVLSNNVDISPDGQYAYNYDTENGISAQEQGALRQLPGTDSPAVVAQGSYQYVGDDGQTYRVDYVADENGFQPQGAHLPTPPPIPAEILRSLSQLSR